MPDSDQSRSVSMQVSCIGCGYALHGLPVDGVCPECGTDVSRSLERMAEITIPRESIPRLGRACVLFILSTVTGAPGIILYALLPTLAKFPSVADPRLTALFAEILLPSLLLAGTILPGCTIGLLPRRIRPENAMSSSLVFMILSLVGVIGMLVAGITVTGNGLDMNPFWTIGSALGALGCVMNLTMATRIIGSVVPGWRRLGSARQSRKPLLAALIVILLGRLFVPSIGTMTNMTKLQQWLLTSGQGLFFAAEVLLAIGGLYLLVNRLWLAERLRRSIMAGTDT